jgi:hypothetical protein
MSDDGTWARRVAEWRASGEPATTFSGGRGFSSSALRYWAKRLERERPKTVALARLVRADGVGGDGREILIEIGRARVSVGRGFDRETLHAVVEVLTRIEPASVR